MYFQREILQKIDKFLDKKINLLFLGSRQTGKTVLMKLTEEKLLSKKLATKQQIIFFDLEKGSDLNIFINNPQPESFVDYLYAKTALPPKSPLFVFIDEIQYLPKASSFLKVLADHFPQIKLILSGSSSLEIKKIFTDRLTGRKISFNISTLSFREFLIFQEHLLAKSWQKIDPPEILSGKIDLNFLSPYQQMVSEILPAYENFVLFGGYPKPSLKENKSIKQELLGEIRDQYARRDVNDILKIDNVAGFNRLLGILAAQIGSLANIDELANSANLNRQTLEKYLFLLEETFIISQVKPYFTNKRQELIKMPKIYFNDTGLRNLLIEQLGGHSLELRPDKGALAENALWHELQLLGWPINFWRTKTKAEVDFIVSVPGVGDIPVEVKYQNFDKPALPSGLSSFIKKYHPPYGLVATKDYLGQTVCENTTVYFVPIMFF
jgi:hypothetical protein